MAKSKFRTQYDRERKHANAGSRTRVIYQLEADKDGVSDLVPCGEENVYEYIQSFKESTDIHVLLARFANGDETALNQRVGTFFDTCMIPTNYADILNTVIKGHSMFDMLPKDIKEKFGNNFDVFMQSMSNSKDFAEKVGADLAAQFGFTEDALAGAAVAAGSALSGVAGEPEQQQSEPPAAASGDKASA